MNVQKLFPMLIVIMSNWTISTSTAQPMSPTANYDIFRFDFTWQPLRPLLNDTVRFRAVGLDGPSDTLHGRWAAINASSFRWYQQMPKADFRLVHVGPEFSRLASDYFEGRYRLSVSMLPSTEPQADQSSSPDSSWSRIDIIKYVGLQARIRSVLIVQNRTVAGRAGRRLVCRFWGYPLVESLEMATPDAEACRKSSSHFETAEAEPYIDLVSDCSTDQLPTGQYSCYGRNSLGEARLKCRLSAEQTGMVGSMTDCPELDANNFAASSAAHGRLVASSDGQMDAAGAAGTSAGSCTRIATVFGCLRVVAASVSALLVCQKYSYY